MPYIYLASPYTDNDKFIKISRYRAALRACTELMAAGEVVFCPVAYGHSLEDKSRQTFPYDYWIRWSKAMLAPAKSLYVLTIPGWDTSAGVKLEVHLAHELEIPVLGFSHAADSEPVSGWEIIQEFGLTPRRRVPVISFPKDSGAD
jgi:hypothetical protein